MQVRVNGLNGVECVATECFIDMLPWLTCPCFVMAFVCVTAMLFIMVDVCCTVCGPHV